MTTLNFQITTAGRQAAIDADATGLQLTITEVGYGNGTWSPDASATAPQDEFKRLPAGGGDNPAPLYVHVTALDESSDTYQANEVGIYAGNVLFAIWSKGLQPGVDGPGKINTQSGAFAFDLLLTDVPPGSVTVGDTNFSVSIATENKVGVSEVATQSETDLGEADNLFVTPKKLLKWLKNRLSSSVTSGSTETPANSAAVKTAHDAGTRQASESEYGQVMRATQAEFDAGTNDTKYVTPKKLRMGFSYDPDSHFVFPTWLGGLIIQWGERRAGGVNYVCSYNFAFPSKCFSVIPSRVTSLAAGMEYVQVFTKDEQTFSVHGYAKTTQSDQSFTFIAFGV